MNSPQQARHGWPLLPTTTALVVCVAVAAARTAESSDSPGLKPPVTADSPPASAPAPSTGDAPALLTVEERALNEFLVRDRDYSVRLSDASRALAEGDTPEAIHALQTVLDAPVDVFVWTADGDRPSSARREASRRLRTLPADARDAYERLSGPEAGQLWEACCRGETGRLPELLRRFPQTRAGGLALRAAAELALDRGEFAAAAENWRRLLEDPYHARQLALSDRVRAQAALLLAGAARDPLPLRAGDELQLLTLAGTTRPAGEWVQRFVRGYGGDSQQPEMLRAEDWPLPFGNARAHHSPCGSGPVSVPLWSASYLTETSAGDPSIVPVAFNPEGAADDPLPGVVDQWAAARREQRSPLASASFPIVVNGLIVVRDYDHVTARQLRTGDVAWRYAARSSLRQVVAARLDAAAESPSPATAGAADRPSAVHAFDAAFAENSVLGMLSTDGARVYFVDDLQRAPQSAVRAPAADSDEPLLEVACNRLCAVDAGAVPGQGGRLLWSAGGPQTPDAPLDPLSGCYFLGPPVPQDKLLFVMAECDRELHLLALYADTGRLAWRQPVSLVDVPLADDPLRARLACCPAVADGVVVCPTQLGTLVGVDALTGGLLWVYSHLEETAAPHVGRWQQAANRRFGSPAFADLPLIVNGRVVVLPVQSDRVHCVDLQSGRRDWKLPREGALYAVAGHNDAVFLVGPRRCTGRRLVDGAPLWTTRIQPPAGRGVFAGERLLLPTIRGTVAVLDPATGEVASSAHADDSSVAITAFRPVSGAGSLSPADAAPPLGNLCLCEDVVISAAPTGLAVFPQAEATLRELLRRINRESALPDEWLRAARLQWQLGRRADARESLHAALCRTPDDASRKVAEDLLREVLYADLDDADDPAATLAALDPLTRSPEHRGRYLVQRLTAELRDGRLDDALATVRAAFLLEGDMPRAMAASGDDLADPRARLAAILARGSRRLDAEQSRRWHAELRALQTGAVGGVEPRRFLDVCGALPICGRARLDAARAHLAAGRLQAAELLLLTAGRDPDPHIVLEAAELLASLWCERGLEFEARQLLASRSLPASIATAPATAQLERELRVTIEQDLCSINCPHPGAPCDCAATAGLLTANREFARGPGGTLRLLDHGIQMLATPLAGRKVGRSAPPSELSERAVRLSIVDRARLVPTAEFRLPPQAWRAGALGRYDAGHLLPIADADVHGLSLLEGRILWTTPLDTDSRDKPAVGPFGPDYCVVQAGGTLVCLDPADGRVRWRHGGFDYDAGLVSDDETGLIGDERAVVLFDADRLAYRALDTLSGELIGGGVLDASPADLRKRRWNFGRRLLYATTGTQEYRLRLWDPLTGENTVDVVAAGRLLHHESPVDGRLTLLHGTQLTILSADTGQVLSTCALEAADVEGVRGLSVFCDGDRYYVHLERDVTHGRYSHLSGDVRVPHLSVEGLLLGIDRATGEIWRRPLPRCNLLLLPQHELPILVCISRIRDAGQRQSSSLLVQVLDAATGEVLAQREDLAKMSILHTRYDAAAGCVELAGVGGRIAIQFRPALVNRSESQGGTVGD